MATYQFSALADGQAISFSPNADLLNFDQTAIAAADIRVSASGSDVIVTHLASGKDVTLLNITPLQLATSNVTFANGSQLLFGDNTTGTTADNSANFIGGTAGRDYLVGFGGNDSLGGGSGGDDWLEGGLGNDRLAGGSGKDSFVFREAGAANGDSITDFATGWDNIQVDVGSLTGLGGTGRFATGDARFAANSTGTAQDASDRIIFNTSTLQVFYDADGAGGAAGQLLFTITSGRVVSATDFWVIGTTPPPSGDINGGPGDDSLVGTSGNDSINGFGGNDTLRGASGGPDGADTLNGGSGNDSLDGGPLEDGADLLIGGDGNDTLDGWSHHFGEQDPLAETMDGGLGDDVYRVDNASDVLVDAGGTDTIHAADMSWTLGAGFENLFIHNGEQETGRIGIGNDLDNHMTLAWSGTLEGGDGNDTLVGGPVQDVRLNGGTGDDVLEAQTGQDTLIGGAGNDTMFGGDSSDLFVFAGNFGSDVVDGDIGRVDVLDFSGAGSALTVDFGTGTASGAAGNVLFVNIEQAVGSVFNDLLSGASSNVHLEGGDGDDSIFGGAGDDSLFGGAGNDTFFLDGVFGSYGIDDIHGGIGIDSLELNADAALILDLSTGILSGGDAGGGGDVHLDSIENFAVSSDPGDEPFDDRITGNEAANRLDAGAGNDTISGGAGNDTLIGGRGENRFVFDQPAGAANADLIEDFQGERDTLALDGDAFSALGPAGAFAVDDARFHAAAGANSGHDATDRIVYNTSTGQLWYDADGNGAGAAQLIATIAEARTVTASDIEVFGGAGGNTIVGTEGDDTLIGTAADELIDGRGGNDSIFGGHGTDTLLGGAGNDTMWNDPGFGGGVWHGGEGDDELEGVGDLFGEGGNDTLIGGGELDGGDGADLVWADDNLAVALRGGAGDDRLWDFELDDTLDGGAGVDTVAVVEQRALTINLAGGFMTDRSGAQFAPLQNVENVGRLEQPVFGGDDHSYLFDDHFFGSDAANVIRNEAGNDTVDGGLGNDTLDLFGNAVLTFSTAAGAANADTVVRFESGQDKIQLDLPAHTALGARGNFTAGDARFFAGAGAASGQDATDRIIYNTSNGNLYYDADGSGAGAAQLIATLQGAPTLAATDIAVIDTRSAPVGTAGDDWMAGRDGFVNDSFSGGAGNDRFEGREGDDTIDGGDGNDTLDGGDGGDLVTGGAGNDTLRKISEMGDTGSARGTDTLSGGLGDDLYQLEIIEGMSGEFPQGHFFNLVLQDAGGVDTVEVTSGFTPWTLGVEFENLIVNASTSGFGNAGNNVITGRGGFNELDGADGNDTLIGADGSQTFRFAAGSGNYGNDHADGGADLDQILFVGARSAVVIDMGAGTATGGGTSGSGRVTFVNIENAIGSSFDDRIIGNDAARELRGEEGNDTIIGGAAGEFLGGGAGGDTLSGRGGNDSLAGGGTGADVFLFELAPSSANADTVFHFNTGEDKIQLDGAAHTNIGSTGNFSAGDARFWAAAGATSGHDADDRVIYNTSTGQLFYDADGSGSGAAQLIATVFNNVMQPAPLIASDIAATGDSGTSSTVGTEGDDTLVGTAEAESILALGGNDSIDGGGGVDTIQGGTGNDSILGSGTILGGDGNDNIETNLFYPGGSINFGGAGNDTLFGFNELHGDAGDDLLHADSEAAVLFDGGADNDTAWNFDLDDTMDGGAGRDTVLIVEQRALIVNLGAGTVTDSTGSTSATLANVENVHRLQQPVFGTDDHTYIFDDVLIGSAAANELRANSGNDTLDGGLGNDTLWGSDFGFGSDVFTFSTPAGAANADVIVDFGSGRSHIQLEFAAYSALGTRGNFISGDARFAANSSGAAQDGSDRVVYNTGTGQLWYDADGSGLGAAQLIATLQGAPAVSATDVAAVDFRSAPAGTANDDWMAGQDGYVNDSFSGGAGNDRFDGRQGDDTIDGGDGNDTLDGGEGGDLVLGGAGNDTLRKQSDVAEQWNSRPPGTTTLNGGAGDDTYELERIYDTGLGQSTFFEVTLLDSDGTDTVVVNAPWALGAGFENLTLLQVDFLQLFGTGNELNNVMRGQFEGETLHHYELFGAAGNDTLIGDDGRDVLDGGTGVDSMDGGLGNDRYVVTAGDILSDAAGTDTVETDITWSLGLAFENLTMTGTGNITMQGNNLNNWIIGNAGNNTFNARAGDDTILGGGGNDRIDMFGNGFASYGNEAVDGGAGIDNMDFSGYAKTGIVVNLATGQVTGGGDGGSGTVAVSNVETVITGAFNDRFTGNSGANTFDGRGGNDTLSGGGGNDTLTGGTGNDFFLFDTAPGAGNVERITDFSSAPDQLQFENAIFTAIGGAGTFAASDGRFWAAAGATSGHDANDRVVYNVSTGSLYYDADGSGSGAAVLVATFQGNPTIAATDITVI